MNKLPGELLDMNYEHPISNPKIKELQKLLPMFTLTEKEKYMLKISNLLKNVIRYRDGSVYKGYFNKDWLKEGYGILYMPDHSIYEGFFIRNLMEGRGRVLNSDGILYEGEFANDKRDGVGIFIWSDGRKYMGQWKQGKQHGKGTYITKEGVERQGEWNNGRKV